MYREMVTKQTCIEIKDSSITIGLQLSQAIKILIHEERLGMLLANETEQGVIVKLEFWWHELQNHWDLD